MGEPKPKKTLDQIVDDTLSSNFGISDEDLQLLFEDPVVEPTTDPTPVTATPTVEPVTPMTSAAEPTAPAVSTAVTQPVVSQPEPTQPVVAPTAKSDGLENSLEDTKKQLSQLSIAVQELLRKSQAPVSEHANPQPDPLVDIDDQTIISAPKDTIVKLVNAVLKSTLPNAFVEYDTARNTREFLDKFRSEHSDFDELRPLMKQIVAENPTVNDNCAALPRVYEEAKTRKAAALESMKRELNIPTVVTPVTAEPRLSEEEQLARLEKRLLENIRKRRNAAIPSTSNQTTPVSPTDRMAPRVVEKPMTEEEKMFDEMLKSGPPSANFLHGLELAAKK